MHTLPLPLYHGTSTAFIASIIEHGLGARDPVSLSEGVDCLDRLLSIADNHLSWHEDWAAERISIAAMTKQCVTGGNMNFRHGSTYLSPSQATAVRYALSNSHGSELLSSCVGLYERLRVVDNSLVAFLERDYLDIYCLSAIKPIPVLIEIKNATVELIRTEQGRDPKEQFSMIARSTGSFRDALLQQCNFELCGCISAGDLEVNLILNWKMNEFQLQYTLEPYIACGA